MPTKTALSGRLTPALGFNWTNETTAPGEVEEVG